MYKGTAINACRKAAFILYYGDVIPPHSVNAAAGISFGSFVSPGKAAAFIRCV